MGIGGEARHRIWSAGGGGRVRWGEETGNNHLNNKLKKYNEDMNVGLYHMFPSNFHSHTYLKTHLWECYPELPKINIDLIKNILYS